ncbi:MAG: hypothetical protein ITD42_04390 [Nitrosospira sp.]|nr:hypothetical protein [Nitrosospira sp.]MDW7652957.1 hypothetical protein [Nitrosomonadaceae bacterium]MBI0407749.1 hypothetical protein [Nitrosospira sp.]MBI0414790.1 hypothetical protein [Nitrosospira sp.]MBI0416067.1 hypothetical protein [Nitrosospira sp.]
MSHTHSDHSHQHGPDCGHLSIKHNDHIDYLHAGHLHHLHEGCVEEHALEVNITNPSICTPTHACSGHDKTHVHGPNCGHAAIPHGDHIDYLVAGHLHRPHDGHCDHHGIVTITR